MSSDPAMESYIPESSSNEGAGERNQNLPGMGGIYNSRNLQTYHYAGNNPLKYTDPSGRFIAPFIIAPKSSLHFESRESNDSLMSGSRALGLLGIGTSLGSGLGFILSVGSFIYSEWDGDKKDRAIEALSERVNNLEVTAKFFEDQNNTARARLYKAALALYKIASNNIKEAEAIQDRIDRLKEEGKTDDDVQELMGIRHRLIESAKEAFEEGLDAEYYARYGRDRLKTVENDNE